MATSAAASDSRGQVDLLLDQLAPGLTKKGRFHVITEPHSFKIAPAFSGATLWAGVRQTVNLVVYTGSNAITNVSSIRVA